jgi:hypothetical protein
MTIHWGALQPESEAPRDSRSRAARGTANFINNDAFAHTTPLNLPQPGRIIATHWLRPEAIENGHV